MCVWEVTTQLIINLSSPADDVSIGVNFTVKRLRGTVARSLSWARRSTSSLYASCLRPGYDSLVSWSADNNVLIRDRILTFSLFQFGCIKKQLYSVRVTLSRYVGTICRYSRCIANALTSRA